MLHSLIQPQQTLTKDSLKTYWEHIPRSNSSSLTISTLYDAYMKQPNLANAIAEGMKANFFHQVVRVRGNLDNATVMYFGAYTIKNLPLLVEVTVPDCGKNIEVVMKYPVE